jgi:hypothetical protein
MVNEWPITLGGSPSGVVLPEVPIRLVSAARSSSEVCDRAAHHLEWVRVAIRCWSFLGDHHDDLVLHVDVEAGAWLSRRELSRRLDPPVTQPKFRQRLLGHRHTSCG